MLTEPPDKTGHNELLIQLRDGDALAFAEIYNQYRSKIHIYAYSLCKSQAVAEEIVQEVFIRIWQKRDQINTDLPFGAYIKKITLNHVLNHLKKVAREKALQQELFTYIETIRNSTKETLLEKELLKTYQEAIAQLPPQKKLVYTMSRNDDLSHDEIARALGISKNTVKNHMVEATKFIRNYINNNGSVACFLIAASNYFRSH
jgi:RNA polymerase sigma-70 factor (ECF subfamily)